MPTWLFAQEPEAADHFEKKIRPFVVKYCGDCHSADDPDNRIHLLEAEKVGQLLDSWNHWSSAGHQLRNRTMPPADAEQPSDEERIEISKWIDSYLKSSACNQKPYAGIVTTRRLNRTEYTYTIRDLTGFEFNFSEIFPTDGSGGEGFDNNGETLFLPPLLLEKYLESAHLIIDEVVVSPTLYKKVYAKNLLPKINNLKTDFRTIKAGQTVSLLVNIFEEADYRVHFELKSSSKLPSPFEVQVDGLTSDRMKLEQKEPKRFETNLRIQRGLHAISILVPEKSPSVEIRYINIKEMKKEPTAKEKDRHNKILSGMTKQDRATAKKIFHEFAKRAFRRDVPENEIEKFIALYDRAEKRGDPFEERIKFGLKGILVSPHFIFRIENRNETDSIQAISDFELANRLSYFLWTTMPDEELFRLASQKKLNNPAELKKQIKRMLADPKARTFIQHFVEQWLGTKDVGGRIAPVNKQEFRDVYSTALADQLREETILMMEYVIQENRSVLELIDADYAFLTQKLAKHYNIPDVKGRKFRKVEIKNGRRGGVLGLGAVHMVTSYPTRTSPVLRGSWVLETLLGTPVPSPPPGIPELDLRAKTIKKMSRREILEKHRDNNICSACHDIIDPIGFGLENYDLFGRWREKLDKRPVDSTGNFASGESFKGPGELKKILLKRKYEFSRHLTSKMLGYALGRSLEDYDACTIETIRSKMEKSGYRSQTLIEEIILSLPFRSRDPESSARNTKVISQIHKGEK